MIELVGIEVCVDEIEFMYGVVEVFYLWYDVWWVYVDEVFEVVWVLVDDLLDMGDGFFEIDVGVFLVVGCCDY